MNQTLLKQNLAALLQEPQTQTEITQLHALVKKTRDLLQKKNRHGEAMLVDSLDTLFVGLESSMGNKENVVDSIAKTLTRIRDRKSTDTDMRELMGKFLTSPLTYLFQEPVAEIELPLAVSNILNDLKSLTAAPQVKPAPAFVPPVTSEAQPMKQNAAPVMSDQTEDAIPEDIINVTSLLATMSAPLPKPAAPVLTPIISMTTSPVVDIHGDTQAQPQSQPAHVNLAQDMLDTFHAEHQPDYTVLNGTAVVIDDILAKGLPDAIEEFTHPTESKSEAEAAPQTNAPVDVTQDIISELEQLTGVSMTADVQEPVAIDPLDRINTVIAETPVFEQQPEAAIVDSAALDGIPLDLDATYSSPEEPGFRFKKDYPDGLSDVAAIKFIGGFSERRLNAESRVEQIQAFVVDQKSLQDVAASLRNDYATIAAAFKNRDSDYVQPRLEAIADAAAFIDSQAHDMTAPHIINDALTVLREAYVIEEEFMDAEKALSLSVQPAVASAPVTVETPAPVAEVAPAILQQYERGDHNWVKILRGTPGFPVEKSVSAPQTVAKTQPATAPVNAFTYDQTRERNSGDIGKMLRGEVVESLLKPAGPQAPVKTDADYDAMAKVTLSGERLIAYKVLSDRMMKLDNPVAHKLAYLRFAPSKDDLYNDNGTALAHVISEVFTHNDDSQREVKDDINKLAAAMTYLAKFPKDAPNRQSASADHSALLTSLVGRGHTMLQAGTLAANAVETKLAQHVEAEGARYAELQKIHETAAQQLSPDLKNKFDEIYAALPKTLQQPNRMALEVLRTLSDTDRHAFVQAVSYANRDGEGTSIGDYVTGHIQTLDTVLEEDSRLEQKSLNAILLGGQKVIMDKALTRARTLPWNTMSMDQAQSELKQVLQSLNPIEDRYIAMEKAVQDTRYQSMPIFDLTSGSASDVAMLSDDYRRMLERDVTNVPDALQMPKQMSDSLVLAKRQLAELSEQSKVAHKNLSNGGFNSSLNSVPMGLVEDLQDVLADNQKILSTLDMVQKGFLDAYTREHLLGIVATPEIEALYRTTFKKDLDKLTEEEANRKVQYSMLNYAAALRERPDAMDIHGAVAAVSEGIADKKTSARVRNLLKEVHLQSGAQLNGNNNDIVSAKHIGRKMDALSKHLDAYQDGQAVEHQRKKTKTTDNAKAMELSAAVAQNRKAAKPGAFTLPIAMEDRHTVMPVVTTTPVASAPIITAPIPTGTASLKRQPATHSGEVFSHVPQAAKIQTAPAKTENTPDTTETAFSSAFMAALNNGGYTSRVAHFTQEAVGNFTMNQYVVRMTPPQIGAPIVPAVAPVAANNNTAKSRWARKARSQSRVKWGNLAVITAGSLLSVVAAGSIALMMNQAAQNSPASAPMPDHQPTIMTIDDNTGVVDVGASAGAAAVQAPQQGGFTMDIQVGPTVYEINVDGSGIHIRQPFMQASNGLVTQAPSSVHEFMQGPAMQSTVTYWQQELKAGHLHGAGRKAVEQALTGVDKGNIVSANDLLNFRAEGGYFTNGKFHDLKGYKPDATAVVDAKHELIALDKTLKDVRVNNAGAQANRYISDVEARVAKSTTPRLTP